MGEAPAGILALCVFNGPAASASAGPASTGATAAFVETARDVEGISDADSTKGLAGAFVVFFFLSEDAIGVRVAFLIHKSLHVFFFSNL